MPLWATVRFVAGWMNANEATLVWVDEYSRMAEAYDKNVAPRFEPIAREVVRLAAPKRNDDAVEGSRPGAGGRAPRSNRSGGEGPRRPGCRLQGARRSGLRPSRGGEEGIPGPVRQP